MFSTDYVHPDWRAYRLDANTQCWTLDLYTTVFVTVYADTVPALANTYCRPRLRVEREQREDDDEVCVDYASYLWPNIYDADAGALLVSGRNEVRLRVELQVRHVLTMECDNKHTGPTPKRSERVPKYPYIPYASQALGRSTLNAARIAAERKAAEEKTVEQDEQRLRPLVENLLVLLHSRIEKAVSEGKTNCQLFYFCTEMPRPNHQDFRAAIRVVAGKLEAFGYQHKYRMEHEYADFDGLDVCWGPEGKEMDDAQGS